MTHPAYESVRQVLPFASVLLQRNPGPLTLDGTNTWLLGDGGAIVVDPGQSLDDGHLDRVLDAAPALELVLLTHRHHDHSDLAAAVHERTGVPVRAVDKEHCHGGDALRDGKTVTVAGLSVQVLLTPGHTSDSASFAVTSDGTTAVLTGDTILGRGTTVVAHPDGNLKDYLASLRRLAGFGAHPVLPGHGADLPALDEVAAFYLAHREERLEQVRAAAERFGSSATPRRIVEHVYADVPRDVWDAAELSVRAQLDYLRS